jgi:hypothetical protein
VSTNGRHAWLSLTPEPERELPVSVATLRAGDRASADAVELERARIERLIERAGPSPDPDVRRARAVALEVVRNHHGLLLGLPGRAAEQTAPERSKLDAAAQLSNGGRS